MSEPTAAVVVQRIQQTHGWLMKVTSDLPGEGLVRRFAPTAPPIGWHLWHIARWADRLPGTFPNRSCEATRRWDPGRQIWFRERLGGRWGLEPAALAILETGAGMTDETAALLPARAPGAGLRAYVQQAFGALDAAVQGLGARDLSEGRNSVMEFAMDAERRETTEASGAETTVSADLAFHLSHASRHLGSIEALRGLLEIRGTATL
jgi:hypothetical protein